MEPLQRHFDSVRVGGDIWEDIIAGTVGDCGHRSRALCLADEDDRRARHDRACGVLDGSRYRACRDLGERVERARENENGRWQNPNGPLADHAVPPLKRTTNRRTRETVAPL